MKQRYVPLIFGFVVLVLAIVFLFRSCEPAPSDRDGGSSDPEFSSARLRWEWERLRDPATGRVPDGIRTSELAFASTLPRREPGSAYFKGAGIAEYQWTHRGPWNVGGRTRAVGVDVTGEDTILAGGVSGGMWRSTDGGITWRMTTRRNQHPSVTTIAQDVRPGKTNTWYFGSGELYGNSASGSWAFYYGDGIYKSVDNGVTWNRLASTAPTSPTSFNGPSNVWRLAVDQSNLEQDEIYAAVYNAVRRSTDGGETWSDVLRAGGIAGGSHYFTDVAVSKTGVVYATLSSEGSARGIWRSTDGVSFKAITPRTFPFPFNRIVMGIAPSNENVVYFLAETPGNGFPGRNFRNDTSWNSLWKYTYLSGDGSGEGGRWENLSANMPDFEGNNGSFFSQGGYDLVVKVKPDDENVVFVGGTSLFRSTDGFASRDNLAWIGGFKNNKRDSTAIEDYSYPNHHADQHEVIFSAYDPDVMYTGSDGGVHKTLDCVEDSIRWIPLNSGYLTTQFYTIALDHATPGSSMIIGGLQDNGTWRTSTNDGIFPWRNAGSSDGAYCAIADGGRTLYISKQLGRLHRVDLDENGDPVSETRFDPAGVEEEQYRFIHPFTLDPSDDNVMYLPVDSLLWRNDSLKEIPIGSKVRNATGWRQLGGSKGSGRISAVGVSTRNPSHRVWYGTQNGRVYRVDDGLSDDPSATDVTASIFPKGDAYVNCVAVDPSNGDHAIVVFSNYGVVSLFETTDGGETWRSVSGNLEQNPNGTGAGPSTRWVEILPRGGGTLYLVGTSTGLYSTTRLEGNNTVWVQEGAETIGNAVVDMIDARESDGMVVVATHGFGVFSTEVGPLSVKREDAVTAGLDVRIVPSPMREASTVAFTVPEGRMQPVRVRLFDTRGREVATLADDEFGPGRHTVPVNRRTPAGDRFPSGMYFCQVSVGSISETRGVQVE